jgi:serine protease Do
MKRLILLSWVVLVTSLLHVGLAPCMTQAAGTLNRRTPVVEVYEKNRLSVVNISGHRAVVTSPFPGFGLPQFDVGGPRYTRDIQILGSGFVIHEDGYIITNAHAVEGTTRIKTVFSDGREFAAKIVSTDTSRDIAVLHIDAPQKLPAVLLGRSDDLLIGESVIAIGNPYGYANTVSTGVVSAEGRDIQVGEGFWLRGLIQTDAPINPGNSGGPLLNINGELIGINTVIKADAQNIGFAIPVDALINNISHMLMPEKLRRVRLGLTMGHIRSIGRFTGIMVDVVSHTSPAEKEGLRAGDLILSLDQEAVTCVVDFYVEMMDKEIGEPIDIEYIRPTEATLRKRSARLTITPRPIPDGFKLAQRYFQMTISELTSAVAKRFDFENAYPILIITERTPQGIGAKVGLEPGDLILEINGATVRNKKDFSLEVEKVSEGDMVEFKVMRISIGLFGQVQRRYRVQLQATLMKTQENLF